MYVCIIYMYVWGAYKMRCILYRYGLTGAKRGRRRGGKGVLSRD